jgi:hypothetical protein
VGKLKVDALEDGNDRRQRVLDDFGRRLLVAEEQLGPLRHDASKLAPQRVSRLEADAAEAADKVLGWQVAALAKIETLQKQFENASFEQPALVSALEQKLTQQFRDKSDEALRTATRVHGLEQDHASLRILFNESHSTLLASTATASEASSALNAKRDAVAHSAMALAERAAKQCDALQADVGEPRLYCTRGTRPHGRTVSSGFQFGPHPLGFPSLKGRVRATARPAEKTGLPKPGKPDPWVSGKPEPVAAPVDSGPSRWLLETASRNGPWKRPLETAPFDDHSKRCLEMAP